MNTEPPKTPASVANPRRAVVRDGVKCRCPYCGGVFTWPPEGMLCPTCAKTIRPPETYSPPGKSVRRERITEIRKSDIASRKKLSAVPNFKAAKTPGFYLGIIAALTVIGAALVGLASKKSIEPTRTKLSAEEITRRDMAIFAAALEHYKLDIGNYPNPDLDDGLLALISDPGEPEWRGPYVNTLRADGWNIMYFYNVTNGIPIILSAGADKKFGSADDINAMSESFTPHPDFIPRDPERKRGRPAAPVSIGGRAN